MSFSKLQLQSKFPDVYESYVLQASLPESKYEEKMKFWEHHGINCFERWTVPYFLDREKEKRRPCLRLNHPPDGKCNECVRNCCRYDKVCFMCGQEGHGAFQTFPGGKLRGELKCVKHRNFINQMHVLATSYGMTEDKLRALFRLSPSLISPTTETLPTPPPASLQLSTDHNNSNDVSIRNNSTHEGHPSNLVEINNIDNSSNYANNSNGVGKGPGIAVTNQSNESQSVEESNLAFPRTIIANNSNHIGDAAHIKKYSIEQQINESNSDGNKGSSHWEPNQQQQSQPLNTIMPPLKSACNYSNFGNTKTSNAPSNSNPQTNNLNNTYSGSDLSDPSSTFHMPNLQNPSNWESDPSKFMSKSNPTDNNMDLGIHNPQSMQNTNNSINWDLLKSIPSNSKFTSLYSSVNNNVSNPNNQHSEESISSFLSSNSWASFLEESLFTQLPPQLMLQSNQMNLHQPNDDFSSMLMQNISDAGNGRSGINANGNERDVLNINKSDNNANAAKPNIPQVPKLVLNTNLLNNKNLSIASETTATTNNAKPLINNSNNNTASLPSLYPDPNPNPPNLLPNLSNNLDTNLANLITSPLLPSTVNQFELIPNSLLPNSADDFGPFVRVLSISPTSSPLLPENTIPGHSTLAMCALSHATLRTAGGLLQNVRLRAWPKKLVTSNNQNSLALQPLLFAEVKQLRLIAQRHNPHIARILHSGVLEISTVIENNNNQTDGLSLLLDSNNNNSNNTNNLSDYLCIAEETGTEGDLYSYIYTHKHAQKLHQHHFLSYNNNNNIIKPLFTVCDLQNIFVQLLEAVLTLHDQNITHGDIRPRTVLVTACMDKYNPRQFKNRSQGDDDSKNIDNSNRSNGNNNGMNGLGDKQHFNNTSNVSINSSHDDMNKSDNSNMLIMKLCGCTPLSIMNNCSARDGTPDVWIDPEAALDSRFKPTSDGWSLGLLFYYIHTCGHLPFDSRNHAKEALLNNNNAVSNGCNNKGVKQCMEREGLLSQEKHPLLFDLIERLLRPQSERADLRALRSHPFFWSMETLRHMLVYFAQCTVLKGSKRIDSFVAGVNKNSSKYVFPAQGGWVAQMTPALVDCVQSVKVKMDFWWSGVHLLHVIMNQIVNPEAMHGAIYAAQGLNLQESVYAYIKTITENDFPRLLVFLYELGSIHGSFHWDGDEITHKWNN